MQEFDELVEVINKLRIECPWDKEQTHETLAKHLIEEAYELLDALAKLGSSDLSYENLKDELGDLLLQILLHSKIASENNYLPATRAQISVQLNAPAARTSWASNQPGWRE